MQQRYQKVRADDIQALKKFINILNQDETYCECMDKIKRELNRDKILKLFEDTTIWCVRIGIYLPGGNKYMWHDIKKHLETFLDGFKIELLNQSGYWKAEIQIKW